MVQETGGSQQASPLLETVPGIASVLRNPVADAIVNVIRAGAQLADMRAEDANELVQFAVRRGLLGTDEGERLLDEIRLAAPRPRPASAGQRERKASPKASGRHNGAKPRKTASRPAAGKKRR